MWTKCGILKCRRLLYDFASTFRRLVSGHCDLQPALVKAFLPIPHKASKMGRSFKGLRVGRKEVLGTSSTVLELVAQVGDILGVTPVRGAAQILLSILKTIEVRC